MAVFPSSDRDTAGPWPNPPGAAMAPEPTSLGPLLRPHACSPRPNPNGPNVGVIAVPTDECRVAVSGQCYRRPLESVPNRIRPHQLGSLLCPDVTSSRPDPRCPDATVVARAAHDGGGAVCRQGHGSPLVGVPYRVGCHQLRPLLRELPGRLREGVTAGKQRNE